MKMRVIETNVGIQNEVTVEMFDSFARTMRDRGWNGVDSMIASGLRGGDMLEIGPGPGYVGLEIAKKLTPDSLTGCEISPAMLQFARKNAKNYGIDARYVQGNCMEMPFEDESFDSVISNVLRPGGRYCITDLRRNVNLLARYLGLATAKPRAIRPGFISSLNAAYTVGEITELLRNSDLKGAMVTTDFFGLCISGEKK